MPDPNDPNYLSLDDDQLGLGYGNPASPYPALSSIGAMGGNYQLPPMPNAQRAAALANQVTDPDGTVRQAQPGETPDVAKSVHPALWRMIAGLGASWLTRRHPQVGQGLANVLTETDPNVQRHQDLLNQYNLAAQQAQSERQMLPALAMLGYRQGMLANAQARTKEGIARGQQAAGAEPVTDIPSSSVAPPPTPQAQLPNVTGLGPAIGAPNFNQPSAPVAGPPPVVSPGAQATPPGVAAAMQANAPKMTNQIAGYQQTREPFTGAPLQIPPASEKAKTSFITKDLADAAGRPELANTEGTDADLRELQRIAQQNVSGTNAPIGARADSLNKAMERRYQILHPGQPLPPEYQVSPTSTEKDYTDATNSLNREETAIGTKTQRDTLREERAANTADRQAAAADKRADSSYALATRQLDAMGKPVNDQLARIGRLQTTMAQGNPQADALIAPELLTAMAGGQGSGLRMNEAEISRIVGGRSAWENLKAAIQHWNTNPADARSITPAQQQQIHALVGAVAAKLQAKQAAINEGYNSVAAATDTAGHRQAVLKARKALTDLDAGTVQGGGQVVVRASDGKDHPFDNEEQAKRFEELVKSAGGTTSRK